MFDSTKDVIRRKRRWRWLVAIICSLLLIPFPTLLSPDFTVRFVDAEGRPIAGMEVRQSCTHYTYELVNDSCVEEWDHPRRTDGNGEIRFREKYVWFGAASRVVRTIFSYMLLIAHGSVGRQVTLFTSGNDSGLDSYVVNIDPENPPTELTLTDEAVDRHNQVSASRR